MKRPPHDATPTPFAVLVFSTLFLTLTLTHIGCSDPQPTPDLLTNPALQKTLPSPDTSEIALDDCVECHAAARPGGRFKWNAAAIYPDLYNETRYIPEASKHELADGFSMSVPIDTTFAEWKAWQNLLHERKKAKLKAKGYGKNCLSCHQAQTPPSPAPSLRHTVTGETSTNARLVGQHAWMTGTGDKWEDILGLWIDGDTYRTILQATVKILNHSAGHRTPSPIGHNLVLLVEGFDGEGEPLEFVRGHTLPAELGDDLKGKPGYLYARVYADGEGQPGVPPDKAASVAYDSRLQAGEHDELHFYFAMPEGGAKGPDGKAWTLRARMVFREQLANVEGVEVIKRETGL